MRHFITVRGLGFVFGFLLFASSARANGYTTSASQAVGANWKANIWGPTSGGATVAPSAGKGFTITNNGTVITVNSTNARVRNPMTPKEGQDPFYNYPLN